LALACCLLLLTIAIHTRETHMTSSLESRLIATCAGLVLATGSVHAALVSYANGTVYDTDLNITWLQDANQGLTPMFWADANNWAANLVFAGASNWRLPTTLQPDATCSVRRSDGDFGYGCSGSEMGHLFYTELISGSAPGPFTNLSGNYWSGTAMATTPGGAWVFGMDSGGQTGDWYDTSLNAIFNFESLPVNKYSAWAVHDGNINAAVVTPPSGTVPEPGTMALFGTALLGLAAARRRKAA
jgi:hypothetical protein